MILSYFLSTNVNMANDYTTLRWIKEFNEPNFLTDLCNPVYFKSHFMQSIIAVFNKICFGKNTVLFLFHKCPKMAI